MGAAIAIAVGSVGVLAWFTALCAYDIRQRRLPNVLTLPGAAAVLLVAVLTGRGVPAILGALVLSALYLGVHIVSPSAMGAGDVKLALGTGALTGAFGLDVWTLSALAAPMLTAVWAVAVTVSRRASTGDATVPHGPAMCVAAAMATGLAIG